MPALDFPGSPCPWSREQHAAEMVSRGPHIENTTMSDASPTPLSDLAARAVAPIVIARSKPLLRLDLAAGQSPAPGYEGVDVWEKSQHVVDLLKFPWPWKDGSVEAIRCSHFIEHIPMEYIDDRHYVNGASTAVRRHDGKDLMFAFFDECYRILCPDGEMHIACPCARNNRAFQDPTHRRFIVAETFFYFNRDWRIANKLDHYKVECHFGFNVNPVIPAEMALLHPEAQNRRFNGEWNTVIDWDCKMKALKP